MASVFAKLKPKRRWVQVSLRTLLVLVTLFCVALSLWVVPAERQRRAVAAIEALGGYVKYDQSEDAASDALSLTFLRRWLPLDYFDAVREVGFFTNAEVTDAELAHLQGLTSLQELQLDDTRLTDAGLTHLKGLMNLQRLSLHNTQVTDAGLLHLQKMTGLRTVYLGNTQVTEASVTKLRQALPNCVIWGP